MSGCPYHKQGGHCKAVRPWSDETAGKYPICKNSEWSDCPHFHALCRFAALAAAEVYAQQAANQYVEQLQAVNV